MKENLCHNMISTHQSWGVLGLPEKEKQSAEALTVFRVVEINDEVAAGSPCIKK